MRDDGPNAGAADRYREFVGASSRLSDIVSPLSVARLAATLGVDNPAPNRGDPLPPGWECAYFASGEPPHDLATDGLPATTDVLPLISLPRRVFGGARLDYPAPLRVGEDIVLDTELAAIEEKDTRNGPLVRAVVRRTISGSDGVAIVEEQDILHLGETPSDAPPPPSKPAPTDPVWLQHIVPDPILLFRFSAITFNSHRIHYDHPYTHDVEGYDGLLVQGRLLALLLLELVRREAPGRTVGAFGYRAMKPIFDTAPFVVAGRPSLPDCELWVADGEAALAMTATATLK